MLKAAHPSVCLQAMSAESAEVPLEVHLQVKARSLLQLSIGIQHSRLSVCGIRI